MARATNKLTAVGVARTRDPGRYGDGDGLYLVVEPTGSRRWQFLFRQGGKQREMGLGPLNLVSLADARRKRDEARRLILDGHNPIAIRKGAAAPAEAVTFGAFADALLPDLAKGFRNAKHAAQWTATLNTYAGTLRTKPVGEIDTDDVLACLRPIWIEKNETASRVRGRIERVLDAAKAKGLRTGENPARWRGHLDHLLAKRQKLQRGHHPAMPYTKVPAFLADLRARKGTAALALEFLILSCVRVGVVLGARWSEFDRRAGVWIIPGPRMKTGQEHRVPLTPRMLAILDTMAEVRRGDLVFPSYEADRELSNAAFEAVMTRMKVVGAVPHGFRSSFRDWAGDTTEHPREIAEAALAHETGNAVERAYRRGDALEKRRALMLAWDSYCNSTGAMRA